tara:strand:- start:2817 stop:3851 length:1035 start_codon:yes stop_codon:yes gene_type:complete
MKIAVLNDTHFGARNDSSLLMEHTFDFFENQFFPFLEENNIKTIIHLGDFMDRRKYVNFNTLHEVKNKFFSRIEKMNVNIHMIIGNHDTYYKNTNKINSPRELFYDHSCLNLYDTPTKIEIDGVAFGMIPWMCKENEESVFNFLKNESLNIICGHFELNNHEVLRGVKFNGGISDNFLKNFELVMSGHFHIKSTERNVYYLGTQYEMSFGDVDDEKGFHIFDTQDRTLQFVKNPRKLFYSVKYSEIKNKENFDYFENKFVKLFIDEDVSRLLIDKTIERIEQYNPFDLTVVENFNSEKKEIQSVDLSKDTLSIISEEIDKLETDVDKNEIKKLSKELYMEALSI